ncbi:unknown [Clostridium sp. CAG:62]|jgi:phosphopantetheine attachment domain protein|nr:unknown [Clostridium sp. CAG:62]
MLNVRMEIFKIINKYANEKVLASKDVSLIKDLNFDSMQLIQVITEIEELFNISLELGEELLDLIESTDAIIEYIEGIY